METMERHEAVIDTQLAEIWGKSREVAAKLDRNKLSLARAVGIRPHYVTRNRQEIRQTLTEIIALAEEKAKDERPLGGYSDIDFSPARYFLAEREKLLATARELADEAKPLNDQYERERWSRFFLVTNSNGHIHESMHCSTCYPRTMFAWLPELSGLTEADAVGAHGPHLCSVCFPTAPVEWTVGTAEERKAQQCSGTGEYVKSDGRRYVACPDCGKVVARTSYGKVRAHKPEKEVAK